MRRLHAIQRDGTLLMEDKHGDLLVTGTTDNFEARNDRVGVRLFLRDGGYAQEFRALDRTGKPRLLLSSLHKNLIPSSEHRVVSSPMISGDRMHLFGLCRESLRMVYSQAEVIHHNDEKLTVRLAGSAQGHTLDCRITISAASSAVHITVHDDIQRSGSDPLVEYLMSSYAFVPDGYLLGNDNGIEHAWVPNLRPGDDHVIGDCAFHSPAIVVQHERLAAALIPDLALLAENRVMPASLDLDLKNGLLPAPLLSYGFCGYEPVHHDRHCMHDITMARRIGAARLVYGFHLLLDADRDRGSAHRSAARFLWTTYGSRNCDLPVHPAHRPVSIQCRAVPPDAQAACGMYFAGMERGDPGLVEAARAAKEAVLSAPQQNGLFPTRFDPSSGQWTGCCIGSGDTYYSTGECSNQAYWLLQWHQEVEQDPEIIRFCRRLADALLESRPRGGGVPSWFDKDGEPVPEPQPGLHTAAAASLVAELGMVTGLTKYTSAAERLAKAALNEQQHAAVGQHYPMDPLPGKSPQADPHTLVGRDPHTGVRPQSAEWMLWTARLCLGLYRLHSDRGYLNSGLDLLDRLCLLQSVWRKPWNDSGPDPGTVARSNVGWAHDAGLAAEFARCAADYGAITGEREYCERAAAAIHAALREPDPDPISHARVAASAALMRARYGSAYVHLGRKWAAALDGCSVRLLKTGRGTISLALDSHGSGQPGHRVVFGGLRGKAYRVSINGQGDLYTRAEMESGIDVAPIEPETVPETSHPHSEQLSLETPEAVLSQS